MHCSLMAYYWYQHVSPTQLYINKLCMYSANLTKCLRYSYRHAKGEGTWSFCHSRQPLVQGSLWLGDEGGFSSTHSAPEQER